ETGACVPQKSVATLRSPKALTHDVMSFALEFEQPCEFDAGQFVLLAPEGVAGYRGYSMCNFARGGRSLDFIVKRKPDGGFSEWGRCAMLSAWTSSRATPAWTSR